LTDQALKRFTTDVLKRFKINVTEEVRVRG
jgi:hypothetical protein